MVELSIHNTIKESDMANMDPEILEEKIKNIISDELTKSMQEHVDDMAFIDMEYDEENKAFNITAQLVLCSRQDIISNAEVQAQQMSTYGLTSEQIEEVLLIQTNELKGF